MALLYLVQLTPVSWSDFQKNYGGLLCFQKKYKLKLPNIKKEEHFCRNLKLPQINGLSYLVIFCGSLSHVFCSDIGLPLNTIL
jgi:hypothetical protein